MKLLAGGTVALALAMTMVAQGAGQAPPQPPTPTTSQPSAQATAPEKEVTIVGCVQREADYRREKNLGGGGAAGTGAGVGNEFVIVNASMSTKGAAETATGTAGSAPMAGSAAFELTGSNERQAEQFVGKRVEIIGKLKAAEMGATGPTGGATAGEPPKGVDVASKDLKLRELEVTSVKEATGGGACPAASPR
jgi:hypothetical protein